MKRACKICGIDISHRHGCAMYCSKECYLVNKKELNKGYEEKRPSRREEYWYYNMYRRKGNGNVGSHLYVKDGIPDFDKEASIVNFEKKKILQFGNSQFNPIHGNGFKSVKYLMKRAVLFLSDKYYNQIHLLLCDKCNHGNIVIPDPPKSYDYDKDGFIIPFCTNCGVVYSE